MEPPVLCILIVEDECAHVAAIQRAFAHTGEPVEIRVAASLAEYSSAIQESTPDIALMDLNLPDGKAVEMLTFPPEAGAFPILVMTSYGDEQTAVQAIKAGALDYVVKSVQSFTEMPRIVARARREWVLLEERKHMQEVLLETEKMAALGTLAAGIAHEINTPLQIITGTSEILIKHLDQGETPEPTRLRSRLDKVHQSGWRVAEIVRALLSYAHPSSQQFDDSDLNQIVRDTLLLIEHQLKSWNNVLIVPALEAELPILHCDRSQISQALINLLTNARDAMPNGGLITINTLNDPKANRLGLKVIDQGCGIPPNLQTRIFDPFFTTKPLGEGTGLGLSIVSGMVRLHGGEIEIDSQIGEGAAFTLWFPLDSTHP